MKPRLSDKPRKEGGGKGQFGNVKDDLNADKYVKEVEEPAENAEEEAVEEKEPEPEQLTLDEYYKRKEVNVDTKYINTTDTRPKEFQSDWVKKEKLTVIETKEQKKQNERSGKQHHKKQDARSGLDEELENFGFNQKPLPRKTEHRQDRQERGKGKKQVINEEEFPSL